MLRYSLQCRAVMFIKKFLENTKIKIKNAQATTDKYQKWYNTFLQLSNKGVIQMRRNNLNMTKCSTFTRLADFPYLYLSEQFKRRLAIRSFDAQLTGSRKVRCRWYLKQLQSQLCNVLVFFCILFKRTYRSLNSLTFFIKERSVLSVFLHSL